MASVPVRALPVFDATEYSTRPFPVPDAPLVIVIHGALEDAVHAHVAADAVTLSEPVPPVSLTLCEPGAIEIVHAELVQAMAYTGRTSIESVNRSIVRTDFA